MKTDVLTLDAKKAGNIDLDEAIFGVSARADILHRVVNWQLAKRRAGTHAVKFRSDIAAQVLALVAKKVAVQHVTVHVAPTSSLAVAVRLARSLVITASACRRKFANLV